MHHLSSQWIPPNERSKFLSSYSGSSIGVAIFYPLFGFLINTWSWESIFYFTGVFGSVWYAAWLYFVYDSPAQHPRIDPTERNYIEAALSDSVHSGKVFKMHSMLIEIRYLKYWIFFLERHTVEANIRIMARME